MSIADVVDKGSLEQVRAYKKKMKAQQKAGQQKAGQQKAGQEKQESHEDPSQLPVW